MIIVLYLTSLPTLKDFEFKFTMKEKKKKNVKLGDEHLKVAMWNGKVGTAD